MTDTLDWQGDVGSVWAEMYSQTDRSFGALTQHLLDTIATLPGKAVLDVGCGAGQLALAVAQARPSARVIGVDISPALINVANQRGEQLQNARFKVADAANWQEPGFAPDLLISRHGVMFFPDPVAAFTHLHGAAAADARIVFSCFRTPGENRWMADLAQLLPPDPAAQPVDTCAPGPFAFADPQRIKDVLGAAGWQDIAVVPYNFSYIAGVGPDAAGQAWAFFHRIGPAAARLREADAHGQVLLGALLTEWIARHTKGSLVAFPAAAWVVSARA